MVVLTECDNDPERALEDARRGYAEARDRAIHRTAGIFSPRSNEELREAIDAYIEFGHSYDRLKEALLRAGVEGADAIAAIAGVEAGSE